MRAKPCWAYQGDLLCDHCVYIAQAKIRPDAAEQPQARDPFDESDAPIHCSGCHRFLGGCLTDEGHRYVQERVNLGARVAVDVWGPYYGIKRIKCSGCGAPGGSNQTASDDCARCSSPLEIAS